MGQLRFFDEEKRPAKISKPGDLPERPNNGINRKKFIPLPDKLNHRLHFCFQR